MPAPRRGIPAALMDEGTSLRVDPPAARRRDNPGPERARERQDAPAPGILVVRHRGHEGGDLRGRRRAQAVLIMPLAVARTGLDVRVGVEVGLEAELPPLQQRTLQFRGADATCRHTRHGRSNAAVR